MTPGWLKKKTEPRFRGSACLRNDLMKRYFTLSFSAAMSASLRNVITPILLSR
jgi:hypothetical protein